MAKKNNKGKTKTVPAVPPSPTSVTNSEDDDLMKELLAQLDSRGHQTAKESVMALNGMQQDREIEELETKPRSSAKTRFKARLARKAINLAKNIAPDDPESRDRLEKEVRDEEEAIRRICEQNRRQLFQINPDGHCLYSAVADQLTLLGRLPHSQANYVTVRAAAANYIESHADDFLPFLPTTEGGDPDEVSGSALMSPQQFQLYCRSVRSTAAWGGEPELQALSRAFNVPIYVAQGGVPPVVVHNSSENVGAEGAVEGAVWLSYHRKQYGLGEHYNSLRPAHMS